MQFYLFQITMLLLLLLPWRTRTDWNIAISLLLQLRGPFHRYIIKCSRCLLFRWMEIFVAPQYHGNGYEFAILKLRLCFWAFDGWFWEASVCFGVWQPLSYLWRGFYFAEALVKFSKILGLTRTFLPVLPSTSRENDRPENDITTDIDDVWTGSVAIFTYI